MNSVQKLQRSHNLVPPRLLLLLTGFIGLICQQSIQVLIGLAVPFNLTTYFQGLIQNDRSVLQDNLRREESTWLMFDNPHTV